MALVTRNGKVYFYKKYRVGGRVKSEYLASGDLALVWQRGDEEDRATAREKAAAERAEWDARRAEHDEVDQAVGGALDAIDRAVSRALEGAGYHRPSREIRWLRKKKPRS